MKYNDPRTTICRALASGAIAAARPNQIGLHDNLMPVIPPFRELKAMISRQYPQVDADLLDIGAGAGDRQEKMKAQLTTSGAAEDQKVLQQAELVLELVAVHQPEALWASAEAELPAEHK